jgi:hypothetical protein
MTDFLIGIIVFVTVGGWIWLLGFLIADRRERRDVTRDNMKWARAKERATIQIQVAELEHAPGCQGQVQPALCWCPIHRVLDLLSEEK